MTVTRSKSATPKGNRVNGDGHEYDVIVIGSGPGGYVCAVRAAQNGLKTALVEKEKALGGTCLNWGCIPTKALLHAADVWSDLERAGDLGIVAGEASLDVKKLHAYRKRVVAKNSKGVEYLMKKNGVDLHRGLGKLAGAGRVSVAGESGAQELRAKHIVVACGSTPRSIPGFDFDGQSVISSNEALTLPEVPKSMVVMGAGAVGVEFASIYARFGSQVTIVELLPRLLPVEDEDVSKELERAFRKQGIGVMTGARAQSVERSKAGAVVLVTDKDSGEERLECEKLLVAVGRGPVSEGLGLAEAGVQLERGYVVVDEFMRTSVGGVFAIGDIVSVADRAHPQLAHVASHEGIVVADLIAGHTTYALNYDQVPGCTYCSPEVASVGLTEAVARERGYDVKVGKFPFSANSKASVLLETIGFVKIVADAQYDEVLGVHIIGPHATDMISEAVVALRLEATSEELCRAIHPHPTLAEAIMEAAHGVTEAPIHI